MTGIAFDAVGLVMLSSFFLRHKAFQAFVNISIYPYARGLLVSIPVGAFAAVMDAGAKDGVSSVAALSLLALSIAVFSSGLIFDVVVVVAKRWRGRSIRYKSQLIGSFYLLNGLLFQFVGAYFDLVSWQSP